MKRRSFLTKISKATFLGVSVGILSGCFDDKTPHKINTSSDKKEVLYAKSKTWDTYLKRAF